MFDCFSNGSSAYHPSKFWEYYNDRNIKQLEAEGIDNIKQTVATNYFTWLVGIRDKQFRYLLGNTQILSWPSILFERPAYASSANISLMQRIQLAIFTRMLWLAVERIDVEGLLNLISEPRTG